MFKIVDNQIVQRDLYSAFLLKNIYPSATGVDLNSCKKDFPHFLSLQEDTMNNLEFEKTTPSMGLKKWKNLKKKHK